jgi:hypothetical protein
MLNINLYGSYSWKKFQVYFHNNTMYTKLETSSSREIWSVDCSWDKNHVDYFKRIGLLH